jgi:hypothetical protein
MSDAAGACIYSEGPPMNTDIGGIGVRISFYLQTLFLGVPSNDRILIERLIEMLPASLSARSRSLEEVIGSLYTLIATNMAMAITALILGLKPQPEITFHE